MKSAPDFLIIGVARSGTTALAQSLGAHPGVYFSDPKESHYFAFPDQTLDFRGPGDAATINRVAVTATERFKALFEPAGSRLAGEGSVSTFYYFEQSIPTIQKVCPEAKLILILRDPVERAFSAHQYLVGRGYERSTLAEGLAAEDDRCAAGYHHMWHYRRQSTYAPALAAFVNEFDRDQLMVVDHRHLRDSPEQFSDVCVFLGLDPTSSTAITVEINSSGLRPNWIVRLEQLLRRNHAVREAVLAALPQSVRRRIREFRRQTARIDESTRAALMPKFADDQAELNRILDGIGSRLQ